MHRWETEKKKRERERDKEKRYKPSWKKLKEKGVTGMDGAAVGSCPGESFCLRLQVSSPPPLPPVRWKRKTSSSGAKGLTQKTIFKKEKQKRKNIHLDTGEKIKDNCRDLSTYRRPGLDPWVRRILWRREWQSIPVLLLVESHRQRSLEGYSSWGHKESDMTERLTLYINYTVNIISYIILMQIKYI